MKKRLAVFLSILLAASAALCGCGRGNGTSGSATGDEAWTTRGTNPAATTATAPSVDATSATGRKKSSSSSGKSSSSKSGQSSEGSGQHDAIAALLNDEIDNAGFYGAAFAEADGDVLVSRDADSVYRIASVSKQFVAAAILLLEEDGLLSVNDSVRKYFPELRTTGDVTIHHLLCMRSGIPDCLISAKSALLDSYTSGEADYGVSAWQTASENRNAIERWILERTDAVPDQYTEYSNSNYFLLAEIIEKVTGVPYESFITQRILSPIGMNSTGFADTWDYSRGIITATDGWGDNEWYGYDGVRYGAGDMVSTASDLALWAHEYIPGQNRVLSDSIVQRMTQNYGGGDYGYGLMLDDSYRLVYHLGSLPPYSSAFVVLPDRDFVLVLLDTRWNTPLDWLYQTLAVDYNNSDL